MTIIQHIINKNELEGEANMLDGGKWIDSSQNQGCGLFLNCRRHGTAHGCVIGLKQYKAKDKMEE